jgi:hypothetical protein
MLLQAANERRQRVCCRHGACLALKHAVRVLQLTGRRLVAAWLTCCWRCYGGAASQASRVVPVRLLLLLLLWIMLAWLLA